MADVRYLKSLLDLYPDWPKKGVNFLDIFPILRDPRAFETLITHLVNHITSTGKKVDVVVGLDARGFLLGPIVALRLHAAFVPVRKTGKLPGVCVSAEYAKEYGVDTFEMQANSIKPGDNVIVIDDLIATGGSAKAAGELIKAQGGKTLEYIFVIGIPFLKGRDKLDAPAYTVIDADD